MPRACNVQAIPTAWMWVGDHPLVDWPETPYNPETGGLLADPGGEFITDESGNPIAPD